MKPARQISSVLLWTPQEHLLVGSTGLIGEEELTRDPQKWYIPEGVQMGAISLPEAIRERTRLGSLRSGPVGGALGLSQPVAIKFQDLSPETSQTEADPIALGVWNEQEGVVKPIEGRDLTRELYELQIRNGEELHLRGESIGEREGSSGPEM